MRFWRRLSLRGQLTLVGTFGLAVGLAIGGLLIIVVLHYVLIRSVDAGSRQTADDVAFLVDSAASSDHQLPSSPLPVSGESYVQLVDRTNAVRGYSEGGADARVAMIDADDVPTAVRTVVVIPADRVDPGATGDVRVVAKFVPVPDRVVEGGVWVLVASPTKGAEQNTNTVQSVLLIAYPLLLAALAAFTWRVVGWALRPVEALRQGAAMISASGRRVGRLPEPDGDDEVARLAVTLNDMLDRLDAARTRQQAFVADAAHELRSPIASLRTQLEVADRLDEPPPAGDLLADVTRLGRLVDDLLLLARADEGDPQLRLVEAVDLGEIAASVVNGYANARVRVTCAADPNAWTLGDPIALRRVVDNLVGNAVKYATSTVRVVLTRVGAALRLAVTDDGPGIPAEDRERVFDRFTRLETSRARSGDGGAGLGLAIVKELLRLHNGAITLGDAAPGLVVEVTLPAADDPDVAEEPQASAEVAAPR